MAAREILARRFRIVVELYRTPHGLGSVKLAARVGASRQTVDRDLAFLRREMGLPVERLKRNGEAWHRLRDLPLATVTATPLQVAALQLARRSLEGLSGTALVHELDQALSLLPPPPAETEPLEVVNRPARTKEEVVRTLDQALADRMRLAIRYRVASRGGQIEEYTVDPISLRYAQGDLYLLAWAESRGADRTFKVARIVGARVLDEPALSHPELEGDERFRDALKAWSGPATHVRIRLSSAVAWQAEEYPVVPAQRLVPQGDGSVVIEANVAGLVEVSRWVLAWGADAEALEPAALRDAVADELRGALARYERTEVRSPIVSGPAAPPPSAEARRPSSSAESGP